MLTVPFVRRVVLKHYKSIAACDVSLGPLMLLVGPNGAGKSNFLDALCFVRDALRESLDYAVRHRGGIHEVRRRSAGHPTHLGIRLDLSLDEGSGHYAFEIGATSDSGFRVAREQCVLRLPGRLETFDIVDGVVRECTANPAPAAVVDRLFLVNAAGVPVFRPVFDALSSMGFYNLSPKLIGDLQDPDDGTLLDKFGANLASVIARLERSDVERKSRITEYLSRVTPTVHGVSFEPVGPKHSLRFRQEVEGQKHPWKFWAANMSDGTLRALGILTAVFQGGNGKPVRLVGIEEPETALHPAASAVLLDSLREASLSTQVIVTTHSADLLDQDGIGPECLLAVVNRGGTTVIGPVDDAARDALRGGLFNAGELLRLDQLSPSPQLFSTLARQPDLFGHAR